MNLYLSGSGYWPQLAAARYPHVLCAYLQSGVEADLAQILEDVRRVPLPYLHVMLDSGAFGAWNSGWNIQVADWLAWAQETRARLLPAVASVTIVGLDTIAPEQTAAGREAAAEQTYANWLRARRAGVEAMPVWHMGERVVWLQQYIAAGVPCIGLGGMVGQGVAGVRRHTRVTWPLLPPGQRVHLFGVGIPAVLGTVPCYSTDSTSWLAAVRYGRWPDCWLNPASRALRFSHARHWRARWYYRHVVSVAIAQYAQLAEDVTRLWVRRGVTWEEARDAATTAT